ncbi:uncharacterized protein LOC125292987 [Alosa alosa]|uniref:uncharacterized protein LOC125292987 n=1 Tax=Alosa alosa TaxID=278164 RepID=UPI0020152A1E|nr:uncharacterized protein LOC125292987 [Alosa alosa]
MDGVTLAELKEAKKTLDTQSDVSSRYLGGVHLQTGDDRLPLPILPQLTECDASSSQWSTDLDELGNRRARVCLETEYSTASHHASDTDNTASGNKYFTAALSGIDWRDENENPMGTLDLLNAQEKTDNFTTAQACYQIAKSTGVQLAAGAAALPNPSAAAGMEIRFCSSMAQVRASGVEWSGVETGADLGHTLPVMRMFHVENHKGTTVHSAHALRTAPKSSGKPAELHGFKQEQPVVSAGNSSKLGRSDTC